MKNKILLIIATFALLFVTGSASALEVTDLKANTLVVGYRVFDLNEHLVTEEDYENASLEYLAYNNWTDTVPVYYVGMTSTGENYVEYETLEEPYLVEDNELEYIELDADTINENVAFNMLDFLDTRLSFVANSSASVTYSNHIFTIKNESFKETDLIVNPNKDKDEVDDVKYTIFEFVSSLNFMYEDKVYITAIKYNDEVINLPWKLEDEYYFYDIDELTDYLLDAISDVTYGDLKDGIKFEILYKDFSKEKEGSYKVTLVYEPFNVNDALAAVDAYIDFTTYIFNEVGDDEELSLAQELGFKSVNYDANTHKITFTVLDPNMLVLDFENAESSPIVLLTSYFIETLTNASSITFDSVTYDLVALTEENEEEVLEVITGLYKYITGVEIDITSNDVVEVDTTLNDLLNKDPLEFSVTYTIDEESLDATFTYEFVAADDMLPYEEKVEDTTEVNEEDEQIEIPEDEVENTDSDVSEESKEILEGLE